MTETGTKKEAKLLAVKLECPNGHLLYESQPTFYAWSGDQYWIEDTKIKIQASCDACDINERFFTVTVNG